MANLGTNNKESPLVMGGDFLAFFGLFYINVNVKKEGILHE